MGLKAGEVMYELQDAQGVGKALRKVREGLGMTTRGAGEQVGLSQSQYSRIENGQSYYTAPIKEKVEKLGQVFVVPTRFTKSDWRNGWQAGGRRGKPAAGADKSAPIWNALEWAVQQKWLTFEQAMTLALRMSERRA